MATSVKHAVQGEGVTTLRIVLGFLIILLTGALVGCGGPPTVKGAQIFEVVPNLPAECPANVPPSTPTQLQACLASLQFDTVAAVGDEQRLLVRGPLPGPACPGGDTTHSCRHGPLAKIEPVGGAHLRDTTQLNEGRIIARLFLRPGETEPYPKLGLALTDTTYWWIKRQSPTTALSTYVRISEGSVVATPLDTITIELHPPGTFQQALARFIWSDTDETSQGPCGSACCRP
jgi:hypothetical protein